MLKAVQTSISNRRGWFSVVMFRVTQRIKRSARGSHSVHGCDRQDARAFNVCPLLYIYGNKHLIWNFILYVFALFRHAPRLNTIDLRPFITANVLQSPIPRSVDRMRMLTSSYFVWSVYVVCSCHFTRVLCSGPFGCSITLHLSSLLAVRCMYVCILYFRLTMRSSYWKHVESGRRL